MYANANPISNTDPTGMWTVGEMLDTLHIQGILNGSGGLNYALIFNMLKNAGYAIQFASSMRDLVVAFFAGDLENMLLAVANGAVSVMGMVGICESHMAVQLLTKALAVYGVKENAEAFLKAAKEGDTFGMLKSGLYIAMDVLTIFAACFDGDTQVATETGFKRIDEIQVGDQVWSYNIETGEKSLKEVKQVFVKESSELLHLETTEGEIDATTNHPFYVTGKGWVAAGDLVAGDEVHMLNGNTGTMTGLKFDKTDKPIPVYNLEVEDFQTYFVEDLLVHNSCRDRKLLIKNGHHPRLTDHAHHILPKVGKTYFQQKLVEEGQKILRAVGIDPIHGIENLVFAVNGNGVHSDLSVLALVRALRRVNGSLIRVIAVLEEYGEIARAK
jgi:hypothetical protein